MKCIKQRLLILCLCAFTSTAFAQTYEVLMKNRGTGGPMVYEPDFLAIQPGDSVKFVRKHKKPQCGLNCRAVSCRVPRFHRQNR